MKKLLLTIPLILAACVTPEQQISAVKNRAAYDFSCMPEKIQVKLLQSGTYGAQGCKDKQVYTVQGTMVYTRKERRPTRFTSNPQQFTVAPEFIAIDKRN